MSDGYRFLVSGIEWEDSDDTLPDEAHVILPDSLVRADFGADEDDDEWEESWNDAINAELERQFGKRAKPTFGFELDD